MLQSNEEVEVRKAGDPNDGRAGKVDHQVHRSFLDFPLPYFTADPLPDYAYRYDVAFEGGAEHGEYGGHELVKVAPLQSSTKQ